MKDPNHPWRKWRDYMPEPKDVFITIKKSEVDQLIAENKIMRKALDEVIELLKKALP